MSSIEDRKLIEEVLVTYATCLDHKDFDRFQSVFAREARWGSEPKQMFGQPLSGARTIRDTMQGMYSKLPPERQGRHVVSTFLFDEQTETTARTRSYVTVLNVMKGDSPSLVLRGCGVYHDSFIKEDGRWVIAERVFKIDYLV